MTMSGAALLPFPSQVNVADLAAARLPAGQTAPLCSSSPLVATITAAVFEAVVVVATAAAVIVLVV